MIGLIPPSSYKPIWALSILSKLLVLWRRSCVIDSWYCCGKHSSLSMLLVASANSSSTSSSCSYSLRIRGLSYITYSICFWIDSIDFLKSAPGSNSILSSSSFWDSFKEALGSKLNSFFSFYECLDCYEIFDLFDFLISMDYLTWLGSTWLFLLAFTIARLKWPSVLLDMLLYGKLFLGIWGIFLAFLCLLTIIWCGIVGDNPMLSWLWISNPSLVPGCTI